MIKKLPRSTLLQVAKKAGVHVSTASRALNDKTRHMIGSSIVKNIESAIKEACNIRFRPIIMTSLSTMIAMLPLVIGNIGPGAGEGSRLAVGSTILGGMIISTFFTLYVTPTMYLALAKNTKRIDAVDIELKKELR